MNRTVETEKILNRTGADGLEGLAVAGEPKALHNHLFCCFV
jgi:hypothetical protein